MGETLTNRDLLRHVDVKVQCVVCHREIETGLISRPVQFLFSPLPVRRWPVGFLFLYRKTGLYVEMVKEAHQGSDQRKHGSLICYSGCYCLALQKREKGGVDTKMKSSERKIKMEINMWVYHRESEYLFFCFFYGSLILL